MSNSYSRYSEFKEEDFINDPFFQEWAVAPDAEKENFWKGFISSFPDKTSEIERARRVLVNIRFVEHAPGDERVRRSLARHLSDIEIEKQGTGKVVPMNMGGRRFRNALRVAAIFGGVALVGLLAALFFVQTENSKLAVQTGFGRLKQVVLPDSSSVVLNANSKIEYSKDWNKGKKREVWLEGEAFFDVRHLNRDTTQIASYEQFVVHTKELEIEVLGTSFDIRKRREKTEVVLQTGKIRVRFKDNSHEDIIMKPGEIVTYDQTVRDISKATTTPENYTAWKEKKLILNNPTVNEIVGYLEDNFGKKIELQDPRLGEKKIEGPILLNNLDDALFILSTVLNTRIVQNDSTLIIQPK